MTRSCLSIQLDEQDKSKAEKASILLGYNNLTDYVASVLNENSTNVIEQYESITVENNIFDRFMDACDKASKSNLDLKNTIQFSKEQGFKFAI